MPHDHSRRGTVLSLLLGAVCLLGISPSAQAQAPETVQVTQWHVFGTNPPVPPLGAARLTRARNALGGTVHASDLAAHGEPGGPFEGPTAGPQTWVREAYGQLPLAFEANQGQTDSQVQFLARSQGMTLFLTPTEAVLVLPPPRPQPGHPPGGGGRAAGARGPDRRASLPAASARPTVLRLHFVGAQPAPQGAGLDPLPVCFVR